MSFSKIKKLIFAIIFIFSCLLLIQCEQLDQGVIQTRDYGNLEYQLEGSRSIFDGGQELERQMDVENQEQIQMREFVQSQGREISGQLQNNQKYGNNGQLRIIDEQYDEISEQNRKNFDQSIDKHHSKNIQYRRNLLTIHESEPSNNNKKVQHKSFASNQQKRQDFINKLFSQKNVYVYDDNWKQKDMDGFDFLDNLKPKEYLKDYNQVQSYESSKVNSQKSSSSVAVQLNPPISFGIPFVPEGADQAGSQQQGNGDSGSSGSGYVHKFSSGSLSVQIINYYKVLVYVVENSKLIKPNQKMLNYFTNQHGGVISQESVKSFFQEFGYWYPSKCIYGAALHFQEKSSLSQNKLQQSFGSGALGNFVAASTAIAPKVEQGFQQETKKKFSQKNVKILGAGRKGDKQKIIDGDYDQLDHSRFIPIKVLSLKPITKLISNTTFRNEIQKTQYFQKQVKVPKLSVITGFKNSFEQDTTSFIGSEQGDQVTVKQQGYLITQIVAYLDCGFVCKFTYQFSAVQFTFQPIQGNGQAIVKRIGTGNARSDAGRFSIDYKVNTISKINVAFFKWGSSISFIEVITNDEKSFVIGSRNLIGDVYTAQINGYLTGVRSYQNSEIHSLQFFKKSVTGVEALINKKMFESS